MQKSFRVSLSWLVLPCLVALAMPSFLQADVIYSFTSAQIVDMGFPYSYTWSFETPTFLIPGVPITQFLSQSTSPAGGGVAGVRFMDNTLFGGGWNVITDFASCIPAALRFCVVAVGEDVFPPPIDHVGTYTSPQGDTLVVTEVPEPVMVPMILGASLLFGVTFKRRVCTHGKARP